MKIDYNDVMFTNSLKFIEGVNSTIQREQYTFDDFEQLEAFYQNAKLKYNSDLTRIYNFVERLLNNKNFDDIVEIAKSVETVLDYYTIYYQSIFLVNETKAFLHLKPAALYAFSTTSATEDIKLKYSLLHAILSSKTESTFCINNLFFKEIGVKFNLIPAKNKVKSCKLLNILFSLNNYKIEDTVGSMTSDWLDTKQGKKRWKRATFDVCIQGTSSTSHFIDCLNDNEIIYMHSHGSGFSGMSTTIHLQKENGKWLKIKTLQKLIR